MIYFVQDESSLNIKIGFHGGADAMERIKSLQTGCPSRLVLLATCDGTQQEERLLHDKFSDARVQGEWFRPTAPLLRFIISRAGILIAHKAITGAADLVLMDDAGSLDPCLETIYREFESRGFSLTTRERAGKWHLVTVPGSALTESDRSLLARNREPMIAWLRAWGK